MRHKFWSGIMSGLDSRACKVFGLDFPGEVVCSGKEFCRIDMGWCSFLGVSLEVVGLGCV